MLKCRAAKRDLGTLQPSLRNILGADRRESHDEVAFDGKGVEH